MLRRQNLRRVQLALLILAATAVTAQAEWLPMAGSRGRSAPAVTVEGEGGALTIDIVVPGCEATATAVAGTEYSLVTVPGCALRQETGYPEIPILPVTVQIPGVGEPRLEIVAIEEHDLVVAPVIPSLGQVMRDVDAAALTPQPAAFYRSPRVWPENTAELGRAFVSRHRRGVTIEVYPLRWDAGRGVLVGVSHLVLAVHVEGAGGVNLVATDKAAADHLFDVVDSGLFANQAAADKADGLQTATPHMLVLCGNGLADAMQPFATWKRQRGIDVEVLAMNEVGNSVAGIRQAIAARYDGITGLAYLILVGDVEQVPTIAGAYQGADSDGTYAMVAGDDLYADFLVSRLPARDGQEAAAMAAKIIAYERNPELAGSWYDRAIGVASDEGNPSDFERADWLRTDLLGYGFSDVRRIYQGFGGTTADIASSVNDGVSLINYLGHGSPNGWASVPFSIADVRALANGARQPWIVDVSCSTGDFSRAECLAEAWLRAGTGGAPAGAVAMVAASTATPWVPPCVMQAEIVDRLVSSDTAELGALYVAGMARVAAVYDGLTVAQQVVEQFNLFGDCSLVVRTRTPQSLAVTHSAAIGPGAEAWAVQATGAAGCVLTLMAGSELIGRATTDDGGLAAFAFSRAVAAGEELILTVTAVDAIPVVVTVPVAEGAVPVEEVFAAEARLVGNYPNPCNPRTSIVFELPAAERVSLKIYDVRGNLVRDLVDEVRAAGRQEAAWDGADAGGRSVASGTYFARLTTVAESSTRPLTLVR